MKLPKADQDKANHFLYGAVIVALASIINIPAAVFVCCAVAVAKELVDAYTGTGEPSYSDILWTLFGGVTVLIPVAYHAFS